MTPLERLSAVRAEVPETDMLLLFLLVLTESTSSAFPTATNDRPTDRISFGVYILVITKGNLCFFFLIHCYKWYTGSMSTDEICALANNGGTVIKFSMSGQLVVRGQSVAIC